MYIKFTERYGGSKSFSNVESVDLTIDEFGDLSIYVVITKDDLYCLSTKHYFISSIENDKEM